MKENARRLYSAAAVYELDRRAMQALGVPGYALMQRAAAAAWRAACDRWPHARKLAVICGSGNNGGDGYEIACLARAAGLTVKVFAVGRPAAATDAALAESAWRAMGAVEDWADSMAATLGDQDLIVDAIFGIGLSRNVEGLALSAIQAINRRHAAGSGVLAVDIPSGLKADTGVVLGEAVEADLTVSFIGGKAGLHTGQGPAHTGAAIFDDLDVSESVYDGVAAIGRLLDTSDLAAVLPPRGRAAHKGSNGHVLIVGGDHGTAGAVLLAARAALRTGAGLVSVATRREHAGALVATQPELMCRGVESADELDELLARASAVAIGPGLGKTAWARALFDRVRASGKPLVVDADGLNLLAEAPSMTADWILTPHPGEAGRLLGVSTKEIEADRFAAAREIRQRYGGIVLLKGAGTLIQGETLHVCPYGNPGMATGGMGDALTGVIAGLIAQKLPLEAAAAMGALIHARAGDAAASAGERGLIPSDLIDHLRAIVNP